MAHWTVFEQAFRDAQRQLCIRSGFIGANVVDDCFIGRLEAALERGVDIIIEYGTEWSVGAVVNSMSRRAAIRRLDALQKRAIDRRLRGKLYHGATRTHVKELAVDEDYAIIGSFNWLSNRSGNRHESSVKVHSAALASEIYRDALSSLNHVGAI